MNYYDVIITGSGPAGTSAAYRLAQAKLNVIILEKEKLPRYKTCGGGVVLRAKNLLPVDISSIVESSCHRSDIFELPKNLKYSTSRKDPLVFMTMRKNLDYHLLSECKKIGVSYRDDSKVISISSQSNFITANTKTEKFSARYIIAADGVNGKIADMAGFKETRKVIPALEYEVYTDEFTYNRFSGSVRFDFGISKNGYAWVFPKKDHLSIGILNMKKSKDNLNNLFYYYLKMLGIENTIKLERHGYRIPISPRKGTFLKNRVILTGDAAGFTDPVTAEGITYAVYSGILAAEAIMTENFDELNTAQHYNNSVKKLILPDIYAGKILAYMIYTHPKIRHFFLHKFGQKLSELITDVITGGKTYSELLKNPVNYLKLLKMWLVKRNEKNKLKSNLPLAEN